MRRGSPFHERLVSGKFIDDLVGEYWGPSRDGVSGTVNLRAELRKAVPEEGA
jgi:hypothetical protein